jgi:hypothetical protein
MTIHTQKSHRQEIVERRAKVAELVKDKTELAVANILGVSRETIVRDVGFLRKSSKAWLEGLAKGNGFIFEYQLTLERLRNNRVKYAELYDESKDTKEKLAILKESRENDKTYLEILSGIPTIHALRQVVEKANVQTS